MLEQEGSDGRPQTTPPKHLSDLVTAHDKTRLSTAHRPATMSLLSLLTPTLRVHVYGMINHTQVLPMCL